MLVASAAFEWSPVCVTGMENPDVDGLFHRHIEIPEVACLQYNTQLHYHTCMQWRNKIPLWMDDLKSSN